MKEVTFILNSFVALKKLLALQENGKLILSQNMMERINVYLDEDRFLEQIGYRNEKLTEKCNLII